MANSPALMQMYDLVETHLAENSNLDNATRQAIHLTVAAINDCGYCQAACTGAATAAGFTEMECIQIRRGDFFADPQLHALLALTRQIVDNRGYVDDSAWADTQEAGWSNEEVLDATPRWSGPSSPTTSTTRSASTWTSPRHRRSSGEGLTLESVRIEREER